MATQPQLVMQTGPNPGKTFIINKAELFIGRDISNDIVINDAEVSRKHLRVIQQGNQFIIEDLGSTNGTYVNNTRVSGPHMLNPGESIQMGENVILIYEAAEQDPDSTAVMTPREVQEFDAAESVEEPVVPPVVEPPAEPAVDFEPTPVVPEPPQIQVEDEGTMAEQPAVVPPVPQPAVVSPQPLPAAPADPDTFTGPALANMEMAEPVAEEPKKSNRNTLLAGCGCLVILACIAVAAVGYYIDANFLWCEYLSFLPGC